MLKKALLAACVFSITLSASDIIEVYRKKGVDAAISEIERELATKEYWQAYLKNHDTSLGFYETDKYILITDKSKPEIAFYTYKDHKLTLVNKSAAIVGGSKGDKIKQGDFKTPTGSYDFVNKLGKLNTFYGPFAYATDYPNLYDVVNKKGGNGIWLHGMPLDGNRTPSTRGCVVVNNDYLVNLDKKITYQKTVLIIDDKPLPKTSKDDVATILASMFQWKKAWERNDLKSYLDFYDEKFRRFDGMEKKAFSTYKQRIFSKNEPKKIVFREFEVTPNPTSTGEKIFKVKFYEEYWAPSFKFNGVKDLFVKVENGKMTIMAER
ncbi:MAG: L,D-transpeptidase family protein [Campylobacteraceae bacterium]|jgi:murein L,D-transpeptidase YafK|nr:L,D-transpeptidase family protein [Campylobacteraceae bacterium]